jgi:hypothetical protein
MAMQKFTVVCEFRGGTYVSQVTGNDVQEAVKSWVAYLKQNQPIPNSSVELAQAVNANLSDTPPVLLDGLSGVWCISAIFDGDLMLAHLIECISFSNCS